MIEETRHADFGTLAGSYDRLRPADDNWWELFDFLVATGDLRARRVLDVGCGTGRLARALAERGTKVWGIDPSEEMLAQARSEARGGPRFRRASAEALPFKNRSFDRAVLQLVVHLLDRSRALPELARVLSPRGYAVIATFNSEHFDHFWLNGLFPSLERIDRDRFPAPDALAGELADAGFAHVRTHRLRQENRLQRRHALERIAGRYISTLRLLDEGEFEAGLVRAERELPEEVRYSLDWAVLVAER